MSTPILLHPFGVYPDVAIPADGRSVVAFRISGTNLLRVMFLDRDGKDTGVQEDIDCAMGDSTFARLIVALGRTWLAYRAFRNGVESAVVREVFPLTLGPERVLGPTFGNNPVCLSPDGLVAWQDPTAGVVQGLRLSDGETLILRFEMRPTGLSHLEGDQPVFVDDNRPTEPAMWNPVRAGVVTVGEGRGQAEGLVAKVKVAPNDIRTGIVLPGSCLNPRCADFGESTYAAVSWTPGVGVQFLKFTQNDIPEAPPDPVKPEPIPLDQVEPLTGQWLVSFYEQNGNCPPNKLPPGNAQVAVRNHSGPVPRPTCLTSETEGKVSGDIIGYRVGSEAQSPGEDVTIEIMEARAVTIAEKGYRPWFYWDAPIDEVHKVVLHTIPRWPVLPAGSVIEVNGFCGRHERIEDYEREMWRYLSEAAALPGRYWLAIAAQTHDTNESLQVEPSVMIPPMVRLCKRARAEWGERFLGPNIFCNSGRDFPPGHEHFGRGGLTANPQLVPHWTKVYSGVTGLPEVFGNGGGGGVADPTIEIIDYDKKVSRRDPKGLLVRFDVSGERIGKIALSMEGDGEPPVTAEFPSGPDGRYLRAIAFKPVRTGEWFPLVKAWDEQGRMGTARGETKVKVTEDPVDPTNPPPIDPDTLVAPNQIDAVRTALREHPEIDPLDEVARGKIIDYACVNTGDPRWGRKARNEDGTNKNTDGMCFKRSDGKHEIYDAISGHDGSATWDGFGPFEPGENGWWAPHEPV